MAEELVLYTNPMSRGRIVRWMLEEVGAGYRREVVEYGPPMKTPEYLAINPMGKVPALRHGETVVTECAAICAYLADAFPDAGLAPPSGKRGAYYRWLFFAAGPLEAAALNRVCGFELPSDREGMAGYGSYQRVLDTLEGHFTANSYACGESFTAADVYLGSQIGWGMEYGSVEPRPGFAEYWERVRGREACQRAVALDDADMPPGESF